MKLVQSGFIAQLKQSIHIKGAAVLYAMQMISQLHKVMVLMKSQ